MLIKPIIVTALLLSMLGAKSNSLADLCNKGLENNPKIKSFEHKTSASGSHYDQSVDRYKPSLNISGQYGRQNYHYEYADDRKEYFGGRAYNYNLAFKQSVYRKQFLEGITDAKARNKLAKLQEDDEKAKLVTMILQNAINSARQRKIIAILTKKKALLESAYTNINKKFEMQLASSIEKHQSFARMQESISDLTKARQTYEYNLYNLRLLTKYKDVEKYVTSIDFDVDAVRKAFNKSKYRSIEESINRNTRIKLNDQTVTIAKIQIGLSNSERSPQVDAVLSYGDAGGSIDMVTRQDETRAMLTLNFPVFQGGYVDDKVQESKYLYYAAKEEAEDSRLNIKISLEKSISNIKGGLESVIAERSAVLASKKYFEGASQSYVSGVSSLTDAFLAEAEYRDNQLRLVNTEADILNSIIEAYYYTGETDYRQVKELQRKYL